MFFRCLDKCVFDLKKNLWKAFFLLFYVKSYIQLSKTGSKGCPRCWGRFLEIIFLHYRKYEHAVESLH